MFASHNRPRGRPKTKPIGRFQVIVWSLDALHRSGLKTADEFEQMLLEHFGQSVLTKGQWSRHMRGDVAPQGAKAGKGSSLIACVEQLFTGTSGTYYHPVWRLLDFDVLLSPEELQKISFEMDELDRGLFHFEQDDCDEGTSPEQLRFWRSSSDWSGPERVKQLLNWRGLSGIAVGLIETRMSYLAQNPEDFIFYMRYVANCLRTCPKYEPFWVGSKGRSMLLTMEGMCVLHAAQMLAHLPADHAHLKAQLAEWYESWAEECLAYVQTLTPKALRTFYIWNGDVIRHQGLLHWPEFDRLG